MTPLGTLVFSAIGVLFVISLEFSPKTSRPLQPEVHVIEAVTVDDVKAFANKYLRDDRRLELTSTPAAKKSASAK